MRYERKQKKKRKWKVILLALVVFVFTMFGYAFLQYNQGKSQSLKKIVEKKPQAQVQAQVPVVYSFKGKKDLYGDTNILLLGSDTRGKKGSRSDTIMIASYNENKGTFKLTSVMRDSYVSIPGDEKHKINAAFAYGGPELLRQTIKQNFGIDLQYYAIIDFEGFVQVINEAFPKGVKVNVEKKMSTNIGVTLKPGLQRLNGGQLLGYVRFRHDAIGDFGRVERQQKVMQLLGKQLMGFETLPKLPKLIGIITPYINTNMNTADILFMTKDFLTKSKENVPTLRIPVNHSFTGARIKGEGDVLAIDLKKNKQALNQFLSE